jgi:hypothetical protein
LAVFGGGYPSTDEFEHGPPPDPTPLELLADDAGLY